MTPLTDQQLTPAEIRLAQYGQRTKTWSTATYNNGTEKALHQIALGLKAEVDRLRAQAAQLDRELGETIDDRDRTEDAADKLAYAIAPIEVIGEHSSENNPWENALDLITPMAEVDKLRQQVAAVTTLCDAAEKQATRWEHPLPVPEWVAEVRRAIAPAARSAAV